MGEKFKASYDLDGDVLTIFRQGVKVKESIEVADELILDVDKNRKLAGLELIDAYKFLHTMNKDISKRILLEIEDVELDIKNYRNYWVITLIFRHDDKVIAEKLPAFASSDFKSPLLAAAA